MANKVVLVTGGSRGIGAAACRLAAREGWDVAVNYVGRAAAAEGVAQQVRDAGRRAVTIRADIADPVAVGAMFDRCIGELGGVDALVSNAGVIHKGQPLADIPVEEMERIIKVNLLGHLICNREAIRRMARSRGGRGGVIVNISSMASRLHGIGGLIPYAVTKGGIDVLTCGLGKEAAPEGVRVAALRPGLIDTEMQHDIGAGDRIATMGPSVPMGRGGTVEEVAEAIVWLLSEKASYVTGTLFDVSGGR